MTMMPVSDLVARRRALDPARSFIVQAPAGSGKTELLIQRYLCLLAYVEHPEEIIAVTFTRKAAGEMRERVLEALDQARTGKAPATEHEKLTLDLAVAALARDAACGWQIAGNPSRLRIQTIDSLCAALTRQMPLLSRFGAQPESVEDASALYLEAARATIELVESNDAVAHDVGLLLAHLDNDVARVETLLVGMLARRDQWLRRVYGEERVSLEAALKRLCREVLQHARGLFPSGLHEELLALAEYATANLAAVEGNTYLFVFKELFLILEYDEENAAAWRRIAELVLTKDGAWRKQVNVNNGFPAGKTKPEKELAKHWKDRALALIATMEPNNELRAALHDLRALPPPAYSDAQWEALGAIMRLLPRAVAQLKVVFQSHGQVDFAEVAHGALLALGEPDAPTDLALALDYRIRHLLIDEFQDTSISQYELAAKLTAGWMPDDGRTLFAVGDPMQSIYRFREAEVGQFLRARRAGIGSVRMEPISLSANFRSQAGIVDWVNATFAHVMPARESIATGAVTYTASTATRPALASLAVNVHPFFDGDQAAEAAAVVKIVTDARRDDPAGRIAILVRTRGHLSDIVPRLREAGLNFRAIDIEPLGHRPVVQDLLALTRALSHPADRLAWLALLRAPWSGLTLAELHALCGDRGVQAGATLWEAIKAALHDDGFSADARTRLARVQAALALALDYRCRGTLRDRIEGAWLALGGPACVDDETDLEDADIYFDYLEAHEEAGEIADLAVFEEGLAKLYALPDLQADDRLQIMTIHKAKGLEFDTVIVPGLGRAPRNNDKALFLWMQRPRDEDDEGGDAADLLLAPIKEAGAGDDPIYAWLEKLNAEKDSLEDGRLLYVAATRAKKHLHLLGSTGLDLRDGACVPKTPSGKTLLGKLWPVVKPVYAEAAERAAAAGVSTAPAGTRMDVIDQRLRRLPTQWSLPSAPARAQWEPPPDRARVQEEIEFSWAGETARHVGSVVHRWLQRIADDELKGWDAARVEALRSAFRRELIGRGVADADLDAATMRVTTALANAVTDERGCWLLGPQRDAFNERRITSIINGERINMVIDRTFADAGGKHWIVDYKTSSHEGAGVERFLDSERERYQPQLARYTQAIANPDGSMLGLYFPLLSGWREWKQQK